MAIETSNPLSVTLLRKNVVVTPVFRLEELKYVQLRAKTENDRDIRLVPGGELTATFVVDRINYNGPINITIDPPSAKLNLGIDTTVKSIVLPGSTEPSQEFTVTVKINSGAPLTTPNTRAQSNIKISAFATGIPAAELLANVSVNRSFTNKLEVTLVKNKIDGGTNTTATAKITNYLKEEVISPITWSSSNPTIAKIGSINNTTNTVTQNSNQPITIFGVGNGSAKIIAISGDLRAEVTVTVISDDGGDDGGNVDTGQVVFNKNLSTDLVFNWTRGANKEPLPISVTATNTSTVKTFTVTLTPQNSRVEITPATFRLQPNASSTFTIKVPIELLRQLPDNQSIIDLTVSITKQP